MISALMAGLLLTGIAQQQTDTIVTFRAGARVELSAPLGTATVRTWDRDAVRISASHAADGQLRIRQRDGVLAITVEGRRGADPGMVTYEVTVPRRSDVAFDGVNFAVTVDGLQGAVRVRNAEGNVITSNVTGRVDVESVFGSLSARDVRGSIRASTVNQGVRLSRVDGDIAVETVNGSILMDGILSGRVEASTVNGIVEYEGDIRDGGRYYLGTHNGRISIGIAENVNAAMSVRTRNGTVESAFPVALSGSRNNGVSFTLGTGSARVELVSFNGTVTLARPRGR